MKTIVQPDITVGISGAGSVDIIMEVETADGQVVITPKAPIVNTTKATVKESIDGDFMEQLPGPNRNWNDLIGLSPGVEGTSVRGANNNRNAANLDGFNTINPYDGGASQLVNVNSMAATEITTAGAGAAFGSTTGGVAEMITRSGSNRFELDTEFRYREPRTVEFFKDPGEDDRDEYWLQGLVNFGGPIIRDRLWYYLSFEGLFITRYPLNPTETGNANSRKPDYSPPGRYIRPNFLQKLTYQVAPRHKLELLSVITPERNEYWSWNNLNIDPAADSYLHRMRTLFGLTWQAILSDNMFNRFQIGHQATRNEWQPMQCYFGDSATCNNAPRITNNSAGGFAYGNYPNGWTENVGGWQFKNTTQYFLDTKSAGSHALELGLDLHLDNRDYSEYRTGLGAEYQVQNDATGTLQPYRQIRYCNTDVTSTNDPCPNSVLARTIGGRKFDAFLQDGWRATKYLTLTAGIGFHNASYKNSEKVVVFGKSALTPHISAAWDATHDGRTVVRSSYNQYADLAGLQIADFVSRGWSQINCLYNPDNQKYDQGCAFTNGAPNASRRISPNLDIPRTHEFTIGGEREVVQGVAVSTDFVYKKYNNQFDDFEVNRIYNQGGTLFDPNGPSRNGLPQSISELRTDARATRRYIGNTVQVVKREGALKATAAYTWSQLQGRQPTTGSFTTNWGSNPGQDIYYPVNSFLNNDRRHVVILKAVYSVSDWLQFGAIYTFKTGTPYNRYFLNSQTGGFDNLRAQQGYDARNPNDPGDDRPQRLPDLTQFDLQARANLQRFVRAKLSVFCDYNNILSLRGVTSVQQNDGPAFGAPTDKQGASYLQLGLRYQY